MLRMTGLVLVAVIALGCSTSSPQTLAPASPVASDPVSAAPTTPASPTPTATVTTAPTTTPSSAPSLAAADDLEIRWTADDPVGLGDASEVVDVVRGGDTFVLVAEGTSGEDSTFWAWWSTDGRSWDLAREFPAGQRILAVTAGGPGFVAGGVGDDGGVVWTSVDGRDWQAVEDASIRRGVIATLVSTASGVVAFGWRSDTDEQAIWTSPDGLEWLAATNETGLTVARGLQAAGSFDGRAIAMVSEGEGEPSAVWETTGRAEWTRTGSLPEAGTATQVAGGSRGWIALGENASWSSADGQAWSAGIGGPDVDADVIVDDAGFVAVGYVGSLPGETCGDQRRFAGHTWTSADGRTWQRMPIGREFREAMVTRLLVVDRTLMGYGGRIVGGDDGMTVGRWTASLPDVSRPADASDKGSVPKSCGG